MLLTLCEKAGNVYFKIFTLIEAATGKSAERMKKKLRQTLMTPKGTERRAFFWSKTAAVANFFTLK